MDDAQIAEGRRVCEAATKGEWHLHELDELKMRAIVGYDLRTIHADEADAAFIVQAKKETTGYAAALKEVEIGRREFAVLQTAYLELLEAAQHLFTEQNELSRCGGCGECEWCILETLIADTAPAAPPFAEEKDKGREQLEKDAAAYRVLLEAGRNWVDDCDHTTGTACAVGGLCGECPACVLHDLIAAAEPELPHSCENGKRQGAEKRERLKDLCRAEHRKLT